MNNERNKIKVLLVTGIVTKEHKPHMNEYIRRLLQSTDRFEVKITEEFKGATKSTLEDYDLVILNYEGKFWPNEPEAKRFGEETEAALLDFVHSGKGLVVFHSTVWLDPKWPDAFWEMYGGRCSYEACSRRNPTSDVVVKNVNPNHP
ncbi:MAG: ThuA domain-containing protein, partial [Agathobacter sp.]|nr:ThuA domain-containing protein [Agathobacter sp.]